MEPSSIQKYIKEFQNQDFTNFEIFYNETKKDVFFNILSLVPNELDAEEILQETYVAFLSNIKRVKFNSSPIGYLFKISFNLSKDFYRKRKKQSQVDLLEERIGSNDEDLSQLKELLKAIRDLLTKSEYQIFILKTIHDYTHQEISNILKKPVGTITWKYQQTIKKLKKGLGDSYE